MEHVVLDGVVYVKASDLAKRFRYTPDYISQLCRSRKVDAKLVGRAWFVNPDSLEGHKKSVRDMGSAVDATDENSSVRLDVVRKEDGVFVKKKRRVVAVPTSKTIRYAREVKPVVLSGAVHYEKDEGELLPILRQRSHTTELDSGASDFVGVKRFDSPEDEKDLTNDASESNSSARRLVVGSSLEPKVSKSVNRKRQFVKDATNFNEVNDVNVSATTDSSVDKVNKSNRFMMEESLVAKSFTAEYKDTDLPPPIIVPPFPVISQGVFRKNSKLKLLLTSLVFIAIFLSVALLLESTMWVTESDRYNTIDLNWHKVVSSSWELAQELKLDIKQFFSLVL